MTETAFHGPQSRPARSSRSPLRHTRVSLKGTALAALIFGLVYAATLAVLFMPKDMFQPSSGSYVPPVMSKSITMPDNDRRAPILP